MKKRAGKDKPSELPDVSVEDAVAAMVGMTNLSRRLLSVPKTSVDAALAKEKEGKGRAKPKK